MTKPNKKGASEKGRKRKGSNVLLGQRTRIRMTSFFFTK